MSFYYHQFDWLVVVLLSSSSSPIYSNNNNNELQPHNQTVVKRRFLKKKKIGEIENNAQDRSESRERFASVHSTCTKYDITTMDMLVRIEKSKQ